VRRALAVPGRRVPDAVPIRSLLERAVCYTLPVGSAPPSNPARRRPCALSARESMIANHQIRLALPDDARSIAKMSRDYIENGLGWSWTEARVLRAIRDKSTNVAVVHDCGYVLGFGIMAYGDNTAHLVLPGVHKTHRREV
jgi:hypothetical protein